MNSTEVHISSIVVHANPDCLESTKKYIASLPGAEIHGESKAGKLVIVLESDTATHTTDIIDQINNHSQVLNSALVYHHIVSENSEESDLP